MSDAGRPADGAVPWSEVIECGLRAIDCTVLASPVLGSPGAVASQAGAKKRSGGARAAASSSSDKAHSAREAAALLRLACERGAGASLAARARDIVTVGEVTTGRARSHP